MGLVSHGSSASANILANGSMMRAALRVSTLTHYKRSPSYVTLGGRVFSEKLFDRPTRSSYEGRVPAALGVTFC